MNHSLKSAIALCGTIATPMVANAAGAALLSCAPQGRDVEKPNVVIIYMDDMGYRDLHCYGNMDVKTPHSDKLAKDGVMCTNFYSASNFSSPSRASLMTGMYPPRASVARVYMVNEPGKEKGLSYKTVTMAEMLRDNGYATALIGKWHLGHIQEFLPTRHGFDYFYGLPFSHDLKLKDGTLPFYENESIIECNPDISQLTTRYTERAVQYIEDNKEKPFFMYLAHSMPHTPLAVSTKYAGKSGVDIYHDVIMEIDWSIGQVMQALKDNGLDKNTLVVISSDNGPSLKQGVNAGDAGELREGKGTTFEGGHAVPGIFYMPGTIKPKTYDGISVQLDIYPTVARATGSQLPSYFVDGYDMWDMLCGAKPNYERDEFFYYESWTVEAYRKGDYKYNIEHEYRTSDYTKPFPDGKTVLPIIKPAPITPEAVYNLADDKTENEKEKNILLENQPFVEEAKAKMAAFHEKQMANRFHQATNPNASQVKSKKKKQSKKK